MSTKAQEMSPLHDLISLKGSMQGTCIYLIPNNIETIQTHLPIPLHCTEEEERHHGMITAFGRRTLDFESSVVAIKYNETFLKCLESACVALSKKD